MLADLKEQSLSINLGIFLTCSFTTEKTLKLIHSMARASLNKSVWLVTNTTTASNYIPIRTRISIN